MIKTLSLGYVLHVYSEMPTSGDLKSGDALFLLSPQNFNRLAHPNKLTQPPMGMT